MYGASQKGDEKTETQRNYDQNQNHPLNLNDLGL